MPRCGRLLKQLIPAGGRAAKAEGPLHLLVHPARGEIFPRALGAGIFQEIGVIKTCGVVKRIVDLEGLVVLIIPLRCTLQDDPSFTCKHLRSLREANPFVFLDEGEDVAAGLATKTIIELLI